MTKKTKLEEMQQSPLIVNTQYIKDLSFENPNPLKSLTENENGRPDISIQVEANANHISGYTFEVSLKTKVSAKHSQETVFILELDYAGVFTLSSEIQEDYVRPILLIECPKILFPFVRNIIAQTTQEAGYPSLLLTPIDFGELYNQQLSGAENSEKVEKTHH